MVDRPLVFRSQCGVFLDADLRPARAVAGRRVDPHELHQLTAYALRHRAHGLHLEDELALVLVGPGDLTDAKKLLAQIAAEDLATVRNHDAKFEEGVASLGEAHGDPLHHRRPPQVDFDEPALDLVVKVGLPERTLVAIYGICRRFGITAGSTNPAVERIALYFNPAEQLSVSHRVDIGAQKARSHRTVGLDNVDAQRRLPGRPLLGALDQYPPPLQAIALLGQHGDAKHKAKQ